MRVLSEEEMDEVFGGQSTATVTPTLPAVTVTATRLTSNGGGFWIGGGSGFGQYDENSGSSGSCYYCSDGSWCPPGSQVPQPALPPASVPSPDKLKCIMDAVAVTGNDLRTDYRFAVVNSYGYYNFSTKNLHMSSTQITPPSGYVWINGLTVPTNVTSMNPYHGTSTVYAGGMDGSGGQNANYGSYYNATGQLVSNYALGMLSGIEEALLTSAHEARHQYTVLNPALLGTRDAEADARTYAIKALEKYRTGAGHNCN
ncbi:hypothetical protein M2650_09820 [Luteimonas sp. SX5]|uniref:Uncharacterized protein n=1 Tax=Luteimonas galliterrae TaxID=2940486 RepID=A0ABT0MJ81_9GAMM|nr:hypothetical protein [Luteimonas galliterrae]MCL1634925.1 hypothetical protein [Luteimonas galliterrae]